MNWQERLKKRWYLWSQSKDDDSFTTCQEEVIDFISQLLKEQREICAEIIHTYVNDDRVEGIYQEILNAPEPKGEK